MKDLHRYAKRFPVNWKNIGLELGLRYATLNVIEADYWQNADRLLMTLNKWLMINPNATWRSLEVAFTNANRLDLGLDPVDDVYTSKDSYSAYSCEL